MRQASNRLVVFLGISLVLITSLHCGLIDCKCRSASTQLEEISDFINRYPDCCNGECVLGGPDGCGTTVNEQGDLICQRVQSRKLCKDCKGGSSGDGSTAPANFVVCPVIPALPFNHPAIKVFVQRYKDTALSIDDLQVRAEGALTSIGVSLGDPEFRFIVTKAAVEDDNLEDGIYTGELKAIGEVEAGMSTGPVAAISIYLADSFSPAFAAQARAQALTMGINQSNNVPDRRRMIVLDENQLGDIEALIAHEIGHHLINYLYDSTVDIEAKPDPGQGVNPISPRVPCPWSFSRIECHSDFSLFGPCYTGVGGEHLNPKGPAFPVGNMMRKSADGFGLVIEQKHRILQVLLDRLHIDK